jgi:poly-beta-1,6 N-acetyl-D-glucosamine synthase
MARPRTKPRVIEHWIVLAVALAALAAALGLQGYARHEIGHASTQATDNSPPAPGLDESGPILDLSTANASGTPSSVKVPNKQVALTFDDGPSPKWTPAILDVLARHQVHATFFVIGSHVVSWPGLVRQELDAGDEIGNHTFTHVDLLHTAPWQQQLELHLTEEAIAAATGRHTLLLRPPYSSQANAVHTDTLHAWEQASDGHYLVVLSTQDSDDWEPKHTVAQIEQGATPPGNTGAIVLMHDGGGNRAKTVAALDQLITTLQQRGYTFVTLSDLLHMPRETVMPPVSSSVRFRSTALPRALSISELVTTAFTLFAFAVAILALLRALFLLFFARRHSSGVVETDPDYTPSVTIVVPAFNEATGIEACVRSLATSEYPNFEVVVVDDGSTDNTAALVHALVETEGFTHVRVLSQENGGKSAALNSGIAHADGEIIVTVDGDTVFSNDALAFLVQPFRDASVGAVSGNTKVANRGGLLGRWQHIEYVMGFNLDRRMYDLLGCMPTVPGAIGAFRASALHDVGGFTYDTLAEDTEITMALHRAGWNVAFEPRAIAWTEAPSRVRDLWRQRYRWSYGTMQSVWKHRGAVLDKGPGRRLGRVGLPYLLCFQVALPLLGPAVDLFTLYGLIFLDARVFALYWIGFTLLQVGVAAYALHLDGESMRPVWAVPFQQFVYRQLMYLVVIQSIASALAGVRVGWHQLRRRGRLEVPAS